MRNMKVRIAAGVGILVSVILFSSCSVFLPAHPNSSGRAHERVTLEMLTNETMTENERNYWEAVAKKISPGPGAAPVLAAAAIGIAIEVVVTQLQNEATLYEAQFSDTKAFSAFWKPGSENDTSSSVLQSTTTRTERLFKKPVEGKDFPEKPDSETKTEIDERRNETQTLVRAKLVQNYKGFRMIRTIEGHDATDPAFSLVVGFFPSGDSQMFRVAPLFFQTKKAKAKVLADSAWTWLPPMLFGKLFRSGGHEIDTTVDIQVNAYWRGQDQLVHSTTIAPEPIKFLSYDIEKTPAWCTVGCAEEPGKASGWLVGVPVSYSEKGKPVGDGTFTLKVLVTERDKSNAKQYLEQSATYLKDHKQDIINTITK
jgi:hypothetical protein